MKIAKSTVCFLGVILPFVLSAQEPQKPGEHRWTKLGTTAQINNDFPSHVFRIRKNAGVFSKLELRINGFFVLDWVLVGYEDGATWSPTEYPAIALKKTYTFSLPDNGKMVKSVEIRYHDVGGPKRAPAGAYQPNLPNFETSTASVTLWGGRPKDLKS